MHPRTPLVLTAAALLLTAPASAAAAAASDAWMARVRVFDSTDGLLGSTTMRVAQDERGFVWVNTLGGIARLDGQRVSPIPCTQCTLLSGSGTANRILVYLGNRSLGEISGSTIVPVLGPGGRPFSNVRSAALDARGHVWVATDDGLLHEDAASGWLSVKAPELHGESGLSLLPGREGRVLIAAESGLYLGDASGVKRLSTTPNPFKAIERPDGSIVFLVNLDFRANNDAAVFVVHGERTELLFRDPAARGIDLASSGDDLVVQLDSGIWSVDAAGSAVPIKTGDHSTCCNDILIDREGSLWVGTEGGLLQIPSPESRFSTSGVLDLAAGSGGVWASSWVGPLYMTAPTSGSPPRYAGGFGLSPCRGPDGAVWFVTRKGMARAEGDRESRIFPGPGFGGYFSGCARGSEGRFWISSSQGVLVGDPANPLPHPVMSSVPAVDEPTDLRGNVLEHTSGQVFFANHEAICRAATAEVLTSARARWSCRKLPGSVNAPDLVEMDGGAVWAAVANIGVLRWKGATEDDRDDEWELVPASRGLSLATISRMRVSPRGGVWVLAEGDVLRVDEDRSSAAGWRVEERLGTGQGIDEAIAPRDIAESEDGAVWVSSVNGTLTWIPGSARRASTVVPGIFLTEVLVEDRPAPLDRPLTLPNGRNRIELRFSVPVFRDPSRVRFRYRLRESDPWSPPTRDASLRFAGLGTGRYAIAVQATLDPSSDPEQARWTPGPASIEITIRPPWYLQGWFLGLVVALVAAVAYGVHHARVRGLLRLERQRARIARDLHDEIGSGLGSIGLLAGMATRSAGDPARAADPVFTKDLVAQIGGLATELSTSLTDIVTSLRPGSLNLRSLHGHLVERGTRLCAQGPALRAEPLESVPPVPVTAPVRLNVVLIGAEAVHNAVRHAGACGISVTLVPGPERTWVLRIADDGRGFAPLESVPTEPKQTGGVGLGSMRDRAVRIGAKIDWLETPGGGTTVQLVFQPGAEDRDHGR